jgi:hypothetical protein
MNMTISAAFLLSMSVVAAQADADPMDDPSINVEEPVEEGFFEESGEAVDEAVEDTGQALEEAADEAGQALEEAGQEMRDIGDADMEQDVDTRVELEERPSVEVQREPTARIEQRESDVDINVDFAGADDTRAETHDPQRRGGVHRPRAWHLRDGFVRWLDAARQRRGGPRAPERALRGG